MIDRTFQATDPRTGKPCGRLFPETSEAEVARLAAGAASASRSYSVWPALRRAQLLEEIAQQLEASSQALIAHSDAETALGVPRLEGELARTTSQLRALARYISEGSFVEPIIDTGIETNSDVRRMLVPLGAVAVFGASNFPLAFGVAGGDTAAALAAGCPVVVKGHPAHPATSDVAGAAIRNACERMGAPPGTFSLVQGQGESTGKALVMAPGITAVAFTGSLAGGTALQRDASTRSEPIPVFAEMGSINPVFVLPLAAQARCQEIAAGYATSMTQGAGQFCTKPGLLFVPDTPAGQALVSDLSRHIQDMPLMALLTEKIARGHDAWVDELKELPGVRATGAAATGPRPGNTVAPALMTTDLETYRSTSRLQEECFGPASVAVVCDLRQMLEAAEELPGSLTASIHGEPDEDEMLALLSAALMRRVGRLVVNGYPTGVAVSPAMQHGGPWPATSSPSHTSVGMTSVERFLRPVAFQNYQDSLLPPELQDTNPLGLLRFVDWSLTREPVVRN